MRIFLSSLLVLAHLLCLSLPTIGAVLDTDVQVDRTRVTEGSSGTTEGGSWASFLNPSHVIDSIQNATSALVAPESSPLNFWETAKEYEKLLQDYVPRLLEDAAELFRSTNFTDITSSMQHIVNCTTTFRNDIKDALDAHNITFDTFAKELEGVFMAIVHDLENIPPPDNAPGHAERAEMVDKVLDDAALALINLAARHGIEEEVVTTYMTALKPPVQALIVTIGDINEQYPDLFPALAFTVATLLIPEEWILAPLLRVFGFGPAGPVKGWIAAWLQSRFWGAAVTSGSWFSLLQKAGMTGVYPIWAGLLTKAPLWVGGLLALFFSHSQM